MKEKNYPFDLVRHDREGAIDEADLMNRPFAAMGSSFKEDAKRFVPGEQLEIAINTAIAVGQPLLITGEPGTGKTQAAYYTAYKLGIEPVIHFQVKSDSSATDLLYHFDSVRYFYDANLAARGNREVKKSDYVERRAFWEAIDSPTLRVLLIDEVDKAPRDFPNDLLHELNQMEFTVAETGQRFSAPRSRRPIVFITSNSERRLPEPFLRRCVYHHIRFDYKIIEQAVESRRDEYGNLSKEFVDLAIRRFLALRERHLRKKPSTGELLVWLRVLSLATDASPEWLNRELSSLPYLNVLLKDHQDVEELANKRTG
ncbi:MAG: MoxR family ATPase [Blastocatellia bacterium]